MQVENILLDHVSWMEGQKYAPGYIGGMIKAIKSWLEYNHIEIKRKIKIRNEDVPVRIQDEKVPDQDQLRQILDAGAPRDRVIISLMAFSGIRPQVMGTVERDDGLCLGDMPELVIDGDRVRFEKMPARIIVRANLSKTRNKYMTFLSEQGCKYVLGYLQARIARGEILKPDSALIAVGHGYRIKGRRKDDSNLYLTTTNISSSIRPIIWSVMKIRPYALRAYFDTQMLMAESHGCMTHAYRQFFMGHKGDMEARYTTNKGMLTEQMMEDMRRAYTQSQMFLATDSSGAGMDKKEMLLEMWRQQATMYGVDPPVLAQDPKSEQTPDRIKQEEPVGRNPFESKIVKDEQSLLEHSARGWDMDKELSDGRFLVRRPITQKVES